MVYLILTLIAFVLFVVYNSVAIGIFGIPESLSNTYYLYEQKKKGLGNLFTFFMWAEALLLLPGWIEVSHAIGSWMQYFAFLGFIASAGIAFVGTAPKFHEDMEGKVHVIAAMVCSITAILWDFIVCWQIWYVTVIGCLFPVIVATCTKSWKSSKTYWLEMMAFDGSFAAIITEQILHLI